MKLIDLINIEITPDLEPEQRYSDTIENLLGEYIYIAEDGNASGFKRLQRIIKKYPRIPDFKHFLTIWYNERGEEEKAFNWTQRVVARHPEFLLAWISLADGYLNRSQPEKVWELFDGSFDLKKHFPERKKIHISHALLFLDLVCRYYIQVRNFDLATIYWKHLAEIGRGSSLANRCFELLMIEQVMHKKNSSVYSVKTIPATETTKTAPPVFNHKEIELLYLDDTLSKYELNKLYALPRESLIKDLERVIQDGWERYFYFMNNDKLKEENSYFVIHAMMMLAELKATESYPVIFEFLSQNKELIGFYLGYYLTEHIWQVHYALGQNQLDQMVEFMKKPKVDTYSKTEISEAWIQMLLCNIISKEQAEAFYEEVLHFFLEATPEDEVIDDNLIALIIRDMIDVKMMKHLNLIQMLYEKNYVNTTVTGSWQQVVNELETDPSTIEAWKRERNEEYVVA